MFPNAVCLVSHLFLTRLVYHYLQIAQESRETQVNSAFPPCVHIVRFLSRPPLDFSSTAPEHQTNSSLSLLHWWTLSRSTMKLSVAFRHAHRSHSNIRRSKTSGITVLNPVNRFIADSSTVSHSPARRVSSSSGSGSSETVTSFKSPTRKRDVPVYEGAIR